MAFHLTAHDIYANSDFWPCMISKPTGSMMVANNEISMRILDGF